MDKVDSIVIGAGVVGLAIARELALGGREVIIVERETLIGSITSARNSEVIHAGIYYPAGSAKARLCVAGRKLLYEYCESRNIPFDRCGKLIVATSPEQVAKLEDICRSAAANGADDLVVLSRDEALRGLTLYPAQMLGVVDRLGSLEVGKEASFFVADGDILDIRSHVTRMWIAGKEVGLESRHTRLYEKYRNRPKAP